MGQGASAGAGGLCSFRLPDHHGHGQLLPLPGRDGPLRPAGAVRLRPSPGARGSPDPGWEPGRLSSKCNSLEEDIERRAQLRRLRGLWLIRSRTRSNSACDTSKSLQPRGKKISEQSIGVFVAAPLPRLMRFAKYTGALSCSSNSRNSANSDPLSSDKLLYWLILQRSTIAFLVSPACLE